MYIMLQPPNAKINTKNKMLMGWRLIRSCDGVEQAGDNLPYEYQYICCQLPSDELGHTVAVDMIDETSHMLTCKTQMHQM